MPDRHRHDIEPDGCLLAAVLVGSSLLTLWALVRGVPVPAVLVLAAVGPWLALPWVWGSRRLALWSDRDGWVELRWPGVWRRRAWAEVTAVETDAGGCRLVGAFGELRLDHRVHDHLLLVGRARAALGLTEPEPAGGAVPPSQVAQWLGLAPGGELLCETRAALGAVDRVRATGDGLEVHRAGEPGWQRYAWRELRQLHRQAGGYQLVTTRGDLRLTWELSHFEPLTRALEAALAYQRQHYALPRLGEYVPEAALSRAGATVDAERGLSRDGEGR